MAAKKEVTGTEDTGAANGEAGQSDWDKWVEGVGERFSKIEERLSAIETAMGHGSDDVVSTQDLNDKLTELNKTIMDGVDAKFETVNKDVTDLKTAKQEGAQTQGKAPSDDASGDRLARIEQALGFGSAPGEAIPGLAVEGTGGKNGLDLQPEKR